MADFTKLGQIYDDKEAKIVAEDRHAKTIQSQQVVSDTILAATTSLIRYMEGHITRTELTNQLEDYATSTDIGNIASKLDKLDKSVLAGKTDITPLLVGLNAVREQIKAIPETKFEQKDSVKVNNLSEIKFDTTDLEDAINSLDLKVDVKAPIINTEKTDTKLVESILSDIFKAVSKKPEVIKELKVSNLKDIKPTDTTTIEKKLDQSNKHLKEISEKNFGGSSGGGRATPYQDSNAVPAFVELVNGKVPVDATINIPPVTVDTTGLATDTIQTNGTQKTQIVDAGGDAVTVTGGKLDVNVTIPPVTIDPTGLATDTLQTAGNSSLTTIAGKDFATQTTLALVKAKTDNIPALGQALAAASVPVILPTATISTLTPPAAITGFATEAKQLADNHQVTANLSATDNAVLDTIAAKDFATQTTLAALNTKVTAVDTGNVTITSMPAVSVDTTGLATSAKQDTGNTSVGSIDTKTPALGQALAAASVPVILPSATITTLTPPAAITGFATAAKQLADGHTVALSATDNAVLDAIEADTTTIAGAVSAGHVQVDVLSMPAGGSSLTDTELRATPVPVSGTVTANLSATDNAVLDNIDTNTDSGAVVGAGAAATAQRVHLADESLSALENITVTSSGTVTANAGTNLNTSALALETGGNLATIKTNTDKIPALGQALAAGSVPVILPTATVTTLTPPAAITGFATETTLGTVHGHVDSIDTKTPALGQALAAASVPIVLTAAQITTLTPPAQGLTDTQLRNTAVPVSLASVPSHAVTNADITTVAGAVSGGHMQVDVLTMPAGGSGLTDAELRATAVPISGTVTANLSATDNAVLDAIALGYQDDGQAPGKGISVQGTFPAAGDRRTIVVDGAGKLDIVGTVTANLSATDNAVLDSIDAVLDTIDADTSILSGGVSGGHYQVDVLTAPSTAVTNADITTIAGAVAAGHIQVDVLTAPSTAVTGPLTDTQLRATAVPISVASIPSHAVTNAGTFAVQADNTKLNGNAILAGNGATGTGSQRVTVASDNTAFNVLTTSAITGIGHGVKVVTTAGTDVVLAASTACKRVSVQAQTDNTSLIAVGGSGVDATIATGTGVVLQPGDVLEMEIDNLADIYIDSLVSGEGVRFTYFS